jgi:hypothetical protein
MPVVHSVQTMRISWLRLTPSPSGPKRTSTRPTSPCSSNGCPHNDSRAYCTFGTNLQRNRNELPFDPCHLGVPLGLPKRIFETIACSAQTVHLSCVLINTFSKWTKTSFNLTPSPRRSIGCDQHFHARGIFDTNPTSIWC